VCDQINPIVSPIPVLYSRRIRATILYLEQTKLDKSWQSVTFPCIYSWNGNFTKVPAKQWNKLISDFYRCIINNQNVIALSILILNKTFMVICVIPPFPECLTSGYRNGHEAWLGRSVLYSFYYRPKVSWFKSVFLGS
jgi:hypothetical protein